MNHDNIINICKNTKTHKKTKNGNIFVTDTNLNKSKFFNKNFKIFFIPISLINKFVFFNFNNKIIFIFS